MAVTDLTGTKWLLNSDLITGSLIGFTETVFELNFSSNSNLYSFLQIDIGTGETPDELIVAGLQYCTIQHDGSIVYTASMNIPDTYIWTSQAYRLISITGGPDATNTTLIAWLQANATKQEASSPGITIGTLPLSTMFVGNAEVTKAILNGVTLYEKSTPSPLPTPKANLNSYTWAEVKQLADALAAGTINAATLSSTYNIAIGDTKSSSINNETHNYRLIGLNHDVDANNNTLGMTFEQVDIMGNSYPMKSSMSSTDSWQNSNLNTILRGFTVASDLAAVITPAKKICAFSVYEGTPTYNYINDFNGLWIESETEVFGRQTYTINNTVEGSRYEWYANGGLSGKQTTSGVSGPWWLRSPFSWDGDLSYFALVIADGGNSYRRSDRLSDIAPCFCI